MQLQFPASISHRSTPDRNNQRSPALPVPPQIVVARQKTEAYKLFNHMLSQYHYLGYRGSVGESLKYLVHDSQGRPLACILFGSAAWKTAPRDTFIGWTRNQRESNLRFMTNNMRFLILPWVRVPHLASHILSRITRRISDDWRQKYGHPVYLLETLVDRSLFKGVCYQAANWILTGQTKGRTRNDRNHDIKAPVKDVYLYSLYRDFRRRLCSL
jgi:hypothetical protein